MGIDVEQCDGDLCVSSVTPASEAWALGAEEGMPIQSLNGASTSGVVAGHLITKAVLLSDDGDQLRIDVTPTTISKSPMKFSLWILGALFALLGAAVVMRRPDLLAARMFWMFAGVTAFGLAVGPSSGGPVPPWSRIIQGLMLIGTGATILPFAMALGQRYASQAGVKIGQLTAGAGILLIVVFGVSLFARPLFDVVRPAIFLYLSLSVLGAVVVLTIASIGRGPSADPQEARLVVWGILLGTGPFVVLTLIPEALGYRTLAPEHITILAWGLIPASIAYAILRHQLLGIRRLIHRGMVYSLATLALLALVNSSCVAALCTAGV